MKTIYRPRNKTNHPKIQKALLVLASFLAVALFLSFVRLPLVSLLEPIWQGENAFAGVLRNNISILQSKKSLIRANEELKNQIHSLEIERLELANWREREQELLSLLDRRQKDNSGMVAGVLTHPPQSSYDVILIDAGSGQGVRLGDQVSLPEGPLLGTVSEVFANSAKVKLFSSAGERTNAVLEKNNMAIEIVGTGGGTFRLSLPRDVAVEIGDKVFSSGVKSHLVAVVGDISMKPTDSLKEILLKSPANIFGLRFVILSQ